MKKEHIKIIRKIAFILVAILFVIITIYMFPMFKNLSTVEGRNLTKTYLENLGVFGRNFYYNVRSFESVCCNASRRAN